MRTSLLRTPIEIWDVRKTVNEFGVEQESKDLFLQCPAAIKELTNAVVGDSSKSVVRTLEVTIRFNRYYTGLVKGMSVRFDNQEWVINTPPNNSWRLNKFITFQVVQRER